MINHVRLVATLPLIGSIVLLHADIASSAPPPRTPVSTLSISRPFDVAIGAVQALYLRPLGLSNVMLKLESEPFGLECAPDEVTVRILEETGQGDVTELLKVEFIVVAGRIQFLSATGDLLERPVPAAERTAALQYLKKLNGWTIAGQMHRGTKEGLSEIDLRDPRPPTHLGLETRKVVFRESSNHLVMVGFPARPSGYCAPFG